MRTNACREASTADLESILPLVGEFCRHFDYEFSEARSREALSGLLSAASLGRLFVVEDQGKIIGYLVLAYSFSLEYGGRTAFIDEFFVSPAGRGRGLGRRALDVVEEHCRAAGINAILLEAEEANPRASALYEKAGYQFLQRRLLTKLLNPAMGYKGSLRSP